MKKSLALLLTLALGLGLMTGCQSKTAEPAATETPAATTAAKPVEIRIGTMPTQAASIYAIGVEKGFFEKQGLNVKLTIFTSAVERDAAATAGQLDGFVTDVIGLANLKSGNYDFIATSSEYENFSLVTSPKTKAASAADLKGLKVGISNNTVADYMADQFLKDTAVEKVNLPKVPERMATLASDQIAAAVFPEPFTTMIASKGGTVITSSAEAGIQPVVFVFSSKFIDSADQPVQKFYAAYNEIINYMKTSPYDEYKQILVDNKIVSPEMVDTLKLPLDAYGPAKEVQKADIDTLITWMQSKNMPTDGLSYESLVKTGVFAQ